MIKNPSCMVNIKMCYAMAHERHNNTTHRVINLLKLVVTGEWRFSTKWDRGVARFGKRWFINRQQAKHLRGGPMHRAYGSRTILIRLPMTGMVIQDVCKVVSVQDIKTWGVRIVSNRKLCYKPRFVRKVCSLSHHPCHSTMHWAEDSGRDQNLSGTDCP